MTQTSSFWRRNTFFRRSNSVQNWAAFRIQHIHDQMMRDMALLGCMTSADLWNLQRKAVYDGSCAARAREPEVVKDFLDQMNIRKDTYPGEGVDRWCNAVDHYLTSQPFKIDVAEMWREAGHGHGKVNWK